MPKYSILSSVDIFWIFFCKKHSDLKIVWIKVRPDFLLGLIWVQTAQFAKVFPGDIHNISLKIDIQCKKITKVGMYFLYFFCFGLDSGFNLQGILFLHIVNSDVRCH